MLINTAFSHIRKSAPHIPGYYSPNPSKWWYRWAYARKTLLTHWSTSFLHQVIHIRSVICGLPPLPTPHHPPHPTPHPTPLLFPSMQWNQYDNALNFFYFINGQCTEHITSHYIVLRHTESTILGLSNSWYTTTSTISNTYIDYWSQALRCPVTQRCSLDMSLILSCSIMPCSDYLKMVGMDKYSALKMLYICFRIIA